MLELILGKRDYEQTSSGKYPKYNVDQMNIFVSLDCPQYSAIQAICNVISYDNFGKYQDEITEDQKKILDDKIKNEYGIHNVDIDHLIDWERYEYIKETARFRAKENL